MALTHQQKDKVTKDIKRHDKDTGSPEYQIALFTESIKKLTNHLKKNPKDFHSRRGLLRMVAKRRKLLAYLEKTDARVHASLVKKLEAKPGTKSKLVKKTASATKKSSSRKKSV